MKVMLSIILIVQFYIAYSQEYIEFNTKNWKTKSKNIKEFEGRKCLSGEAELKNVHFKNGIIEVDIWTEGMRSYPGIIFRDQQDGNSEILYLRPHRTGLYDDAVQYAPSFNSTICWQLYHGDGYTSNAQIKRKKWIHLKLELNNNKAIFYFDNSSEPLLEINLAHKAVAGSIKLRSWNDKTYFSNFRIQKLPDDKQNVTSQLTEDQINNEWEISELLDKNIFTKDKYPRFYQIFYADWERIQPEENGLVNITKYRKIEKDEKNCVYARKIFYSESNEKVKMAFGYSDAIKIFLNEELLYSGNYAYRSRGQSFAGTIGLFDTLYLNLQKGLNELFVISKDDFGGWGFIFSTDKKLTPLAIEDNILLKKVWSTPKEELLPESILYDSLSETVYYTSLNNQSNSTKLSNGYITKAEITGKIIKSKWIDNLNIPAGICLHDNKLYVVERDAIVEISISENKIINRYFFPEIPRFPNDIVVDSIGNIFISNTDPDPYAIDIFVLKEKRIIPWLISEELSSINGIYYNAGSLIVGNSGKNKLQSVNIKTKEINTIISLGSGVIDGIRIDNNGDFLVSLWKGELFRISKSGEIVRLLYSTGDYNIADFEYIKEKKMILIPTFLGKNIESFKFVK